MVDIKTGNNTPQAEPNQEPFISQLSEDFKEYYKMIAEEFS